MKYEMRAVRDREEWLAFAQRADGGIYTTAGFMAFNSAAPPSSPRRAIADRPVIERAMAKLRAEYGWGDFAKVGGPLISQTGFMDCDSSGERRIVAVAETEVRGGWWLILPVDYPECLGGPEGLSFAVRACGRDVVLFARELAERRSGRITVPEFATTVEFARIDGKVCVFSDHPDAPLIVRDLRHDAQGEGS